MTMKGEGGRQDMKTQDFKSKIKIWWRIYNLKMDF